VSWKRYFTPVNTTGQMSPISTGVRPNMSRTNYSSYLPDVYSGHPNRFPSTILTAKDVARIDDGTFPDKRLTVKVREVLGAWYVSISVPDSLFDDISTLVNACICIDTGMSPIIGLVK
jgi:hypothetical protein